jgi:hypothetical protein
MPAQPNTVEPAGRPDEYWSNTVVNQQRSSSGQTVAGPANQRSNTGQTLAQQRSNTTAAKRRSVKQQRARPSTARPPVRCGSNAARQAGQKYRLPGDRVLLDRQPNTVFDQWSNALTTGHTPMGALAGYLASRCRAAPIKYLSTSGRILFDQ